MRLVLLGDLHFYRLWAPPWRLFNKRLLGLANVWVKRRLKFNHALLPPILDRIVSLRPDLVVLTGDLTSTSLESEFDLAMRHLSPLISQCQVLVVPGNHDRYTHAAARELVMERRLPSLVPAKFPHFRRLSPKWTMLALNAATPRLLTARGQVGSAQLAELRRHLADMRSDESLIIACHYPLGTPAGISHHVGHVLADRQSLVDVLKEYTGAGRVVYIHGHVHESWCWKPEGLGLDRVLTINAGAPCMVDHRYAAGQGFWQIDLFDDAPGRLTAVHHLPEPDAAAGVSKGIAALRWQTRQAK